MGKGTQNNYRTIKMRGRRKREHGIRYKWNFLDCFWKRCWRRVMQFCRGPYSRVCVIFTYSHPWPSAECLNLYITVIIILTKCVPNMVTLQSKIKWSCVVFTYHRWCPNACTLNILWSVGVCIEYSGYLKCQNNTLKY